VDILRVQEIIGMPHMARLPRCREDVMGVMNLRGMVVPVFDLRIRLNLSFDPNSPTVIIVMRQEEKIMGGIVDEVRDVLHIKGSEVQDAPLFVSAGKDGQSTARSFCLEGLSHKNGETVIILNVDRVYALGENA
jgi:purine-binding chemotaxis protein CheW